MASVFAPHVPDRMDASLVFSAGLMDSRHRYLTATSWWRMRTRRSESGDHERCSDRFSPSRLDSKSDHFQKNRQAVLEQLAELDKLLAAARAGGGEKNVARHHGRGKLLVRQRIELLVDRDSPFLELSPIAATGTEFEVGASTTAGIGVVSGVECYISGNDPTFAVER